MNDEPLINRLSTSRPIKMDIAARRVVPSARNEGRMSWLKANKKVIESLKKPKKEKVKTIAAAPSQKGAAAGWQPNFGSGKKK